MLRFRDERGHTSSVALHAGDAIGPLLTALRQLSAELGTDDVDEVAEPVRGIIGFGCGATCAGGRLLDLQTTDEAVHRFVLVRETAMLLARTLAAGWTETDELIDQLAAHHLNS
ncbi:MAG: hypothetical protein WDO12_12230 [Pseudomonadota bacterium]